MEAKVQHINVNTINLAGVSFLTGPETLKKFRDCVNVGDSCYIVSDAPGDWRVDGDFQVVHTLSATPLGWVPRLDTLKRYMGEAYEQDNRPRHNKELMRYNITKAIREQIVTDRNTSEVATQGTVSAVLYLDGERYNETKDGKIASVSVSF